ncbi:hypothetical protein KR222_003266, partial [Zaprionus bogoriensis]
QCQQFLLAALFSCAVAAPTAEDAAAQITKFASTAEKGTYGHQLETSNQIVTAEEGVGGVYAQGFYQYVSPEGQLVRVNYLADQNGFQPQSDLLPTPPPIPDYILRSIQYIQEHPTPEELADRQVRAQQI